MDKASEFLACKKSQRTSTSFWLGERALPRPLVSHVVLKVSPERLGYFITSSGHISRNACVSHGATGSSVMTSAPVLKQAPAGRDSMHDEFMGGGTHVRVQSIFYDVFATPPSGCRLLTRSRVVRACYSGLLRRIARTSIFDFHFARILHAELPSNLLVEPACHFAHYLDGHITSLLIQVHWENADSCGTGRSSGPFELDEPYFVFFVLFIYVRGGAHPVWNVLLCLFAASAATRGHTADRYGGRKQGSHTNPTSSPSFFQTAGW